MNIKEIQNLIDRLGLLPHPEGGYYSETYVSEIGIPGMDRQLMTSIYFLLTSDSVSNFHRIKSDEIWFYHGGSALIVHTLDDEGHKQTKIGIAINDGEMPQFLVKAGTIFGSSIVDENSYSLVSCVVAPGFDFDDFELFDETNLLKQYPDHSEIIKRLTP